MAEDWKSKKAKQARVRRANKKKRLEFLKQKASADGATTKVAAEYFQALKKRRSVLEYEKQRVAKYRKQLKKEMTDKLPGAIEKAVKRKKAKHLYYLKKKALGDSMTWKAAERSRQRWKLIKKKIESESQGINSRFMNFRKSEITPLAAAVRYCDLEAVSYILKLKASPTRRCSSTQICTPLYDAAWIGKPKIAQLLLEKSAILEGGLTHGALHGVIHNKMYSTLKIMLNMGCDVNEYYLEQTPLGAALTCGNNKSGDVRLVRTLLSAKADIMKRTKMCYHPHFHGMMTNHKDLARKYSNKRCNALLNTED